jgi:hypothetical protein
MVSLIAIIRTAIGVAIARAVEAAGTLQLARQLLSTVAVGAAIVRAVRVAVVLRPA